jgi:hypothetical protein
VEIGGLGVVVSNSVWDSARAYVSGDFQRLRGETGGISQALH